MTTQNSCQIKFANNLNKRTGLRIRLHDDKITTEVKLDGVSYIHCQTVPYTQIESISDNSKPGERNNLHLAVATKNSNDRNKIMQTNDIDLDSIIVSLLNPETDMPSPEVLEQEAYELLMSKHAGRSASSIGDLDDMNEDFTSQFDATDLL